MAKPKKPVADEEEDPKGKPGSKKAPPFIKKGGKGKK